jgi:hypothetical protein
MHQRTRLVLLVFLLSFLLMGNMAPPYAPCVGKSAGDPCARGYSCAANNGTCQLISNCTDSPGSSANECLICQRGAVTVPNSPLEE